MTQSQSLKWSAMYSKFSEVSCICICMWARSLQLCPTPCDPVDRIPLFHGIFQARILEWVAISSPRGSSWPKALIHKETGVSCVFCIRRQVLYHWATGTAHIFIHSIINLWFISIKVFSPNFQEDAPCFSKNVSSSQVAAGILKNFLWLQISFSQEA